MGSWIRPEHCVLRSKYVTERPVVGIGRVQMVNVLQSGNRILESTPNGLVRSHSNDSPELTSGIWRAVNSHVNGLSREAGLQSVPFRNSITSLAASSDHSFGC